MWRWFIKRWPHIILWTGVLLLWLASINSEHLPIEALFVGPVLMLAGAVMIGWNKRKLW
jgi:hypothetical protein